MRFALCLSLIVFCAACSLVGSGRPSASTLEGIALVASVDANQASATALDFVFVYDAAIAPLLPRDAAAWFARRDALAASAGGGMEVVSVQITPAFRAPEVPLPRQHSRRCG